MMRRARFPLAAATLAFLVACQSDRLTRSIDGPMFAVSDGAHHGNPDFFFLPPLFNNPNKDPNFEPAAFNALLRPAVEICELGDITRECIAGPPIKRFAPGTVNLSTADQQYQVNWNTSESALNVNKFYRIRVLVGPTLLGFADVDPVSTGSQLKNVQTGEYIGLVDGRTLPIKFRIENGALCAAHGTPCAAKTINLAQGGGVELIVPGEDFHFDIPAGTQGTSGGQAVSEVTFNLEVCGGIDVDLPKVGQCLRVTALYDASGTALSLSNPALISMCSFQAVSEGQRELITLHQQDGDLIRALPHAHPNCNVIGARAIAPSTLAARAWGWMRNVAATLVTPRSLYAATRTAVLHLGGGGETNLLGATCTPTPVAGMALGTCAPTSAQVTPFPTGGHTISDFQFALPAKMDYVNPDDASRSAAPGTALPTAVKVTDWNDAPVQGATVTFTKPSEAQGIVIGTATSNVDGIAQVSWTIAEGTNNLVAGGRGIAAQNNYPDATVKPFMPDIFSTAPESPVVVRDGAVPFTATGTPPAVLINCAGDPGGDQVDRGFYVPGFPGTRLDRATLYFSARTAGTYTFSLTARGATYDGPVLGTATASVALTADDQANVATTFTFSSTPVAQGSMVAFAIAQVSGPTDGVAFYSVPNLGDPTCPVVQTNGTEPPLSTFRRQGVHVTLEGAAAVIP